MGVESNVISLIQELQASWEIYVVPKTPLCSVCDFNTVEVYSTKQ